MFDNSNIHQIPLTSTHQASSVCFDKCLMSYPLQSIHLNRLDECLMSVLRAFLWTSFIV